jgi:hypothetical protein
MKLRMLLAAILLLLTVPNACRAQSNEANSDAWIESLRADLRADKVAIVGKAMQLNDQDSKAFWPIYRRYETDCAMVNDQRVALMKSYTDKFATLTEADAKGMIDQSLKFESERIDIRKKYAKEFQKGGLSSLTIAKFLQLEHRLDLLVDLKIASLLPPLLVTPAN